MTINDIINSHTCQALAGGVTLLAWPLIKLLKRWGMKGG